MGFLSKLRRKWREKREQRRRILIAIELIDPKLGGQIRDLAADIQDFEALKDVIENLHTEAEQALTLDAPQMTLTEPQIQALVFLGEFSGEVEDLISRLLK